MKKIIRLTEGDLHRIIKDVTNKSLNEMSEEEHDAAMKEMESFMNQDEEPEVGIFWFLPEEGKLFDVKSIPISAIKKGNNTINKLHKDIWNKNSYRDKAAGKKDSIYYGDYTQIPRGIVWYNADNHTFKVTVGHWIQQYQNILTPLIISEFNLPNFSYEIDDHWDLGHGWSEHNLDTFTK
jgi:hypothetical protein